MKFFTLFGSPVAHSISPRMHNLALKGLHVDGCYTRYHLKDGLKLRESFYKLRLDGANITVPYKEDALRQADFLDAFAKKIGAVNTLVNKNGQLHGYNTDALGFYRAIASFKDIDSVLILGAGGTAKAIASILKEKDIKTTILNRSNKRLGFFKDEGFEVYTWEDFNPKRFSLIVNTTSAGLKDDVLPLHKPLLSSLMKKADYAFDVIYNKTTPFMSLAKAHKLTCKDGADMLLCQGVLAFNLFFDNKFNETEITNHMRGAFSL